ncbi:MAG: serine/threonine protein kinase [Prevotella sp.]|nr:serine/threonine protein kinase [Prevotella sp.]
MDNQTFQMMLPIGSELQGGRYRVERYLSSGGFGNTYVVRNTTFGDLAAMKEFFMRGINEREEGSTQISVSNTTNGQLFDAQREKFKKEARRLRSLQSPYLVKVHDLFEENGTAYYVMDFVDGESLSERLKRTGKPLAEAEVRSILSQVLSALAEVHRQQIWHLDMKPGNIMIDRQGQVKIIDFGASKQLSASGSYATTTTSMCYTPGFAPAEQIDQDIDRIGPWTDLYALGATAYNLLTGLTPPTLSELQEPDAFHFPVGVSNDMRQLVVWMMNPGRSRRPQSVEEVLSRLNDSPARSTTAAQTTTAPQSATASAVPAYDNATRVSTTASETVVSKPIEGEKHQPNKSRRWILTFAFLAVAVVLFLLFLKNGNKKYSADASLEEYYKYEEAMPGVTQEQKDSIRQAVYAELVAARAAAYELPVLVEGATDEEFAEYKAALDDYNKAVYVDSTDEDFREMVDAAIALFENELNSAAIDDEQK